ncbi:LysR family transcriptional regulator [Gordonia sp. HY442]|uniref:LysR family transcriptional regulator n=1 Tax=Gordonia zhenghanii TaxID=2911516 RepID=UPI001F3E4983|nr:LysR family transcriptional regulator [Gordonia zhenghanii]MCF8603121.1 LysR family transcriptional regulator [Gordonia zhenghanii]
MDTGKLSAFVAVADKRSFSAAAAELRLSQSTVSTRVRELERELGEELLTRTNRRVALTSAGEVALPAARAVLTQARLLADAVDEVAGVQRGVVRLGVIAGASHPRLAPLLADFGVRHPGIELTVSAAESSSLEKSLEASEIDVAYLVGATRSPLMRVWVDEPLCVVGPPGEQIAVGALLTEQLIVLDSGAGARTRLERVARDAGFSPQIRAQVADPELASDLGRFGFGLPVMPRAVAGPDSPVLVDVHGDPVTVCAGLATAAGRQPLATELLLEALTELVSLDVTSRLSPTPASSGPRV